MKNKQPLRIRSISEFHKLRGLPMPEHPLISVVDVAGLEHTHTSMPLILDYYSISLKRGLEGKFMYGQQEYDFDEGVMFFIAPGQVFNVQHHPDSKQSGWLLLIHPDLLWNTPLGTAIRKYEFFDYSVNEALFLSEKEEAILGGIVRNIEQEYHTNIDKFSQSIIVSQIETLLNYCERFYQRQFITRKIASHQLLDRLETLLDSYFGSEQVMRNGILSVQYVAEQLHVSPGYLTGLLRALTGQSTQQHIHDKLIEKAKEKLSTTDLSASEIAYELGFEHSQSFSKLFKAKTSLSPLAFRKAFN
jgi:AraC family transcriptional regulator, transcriptional activator of pobA